MKRGDAPMPVVFYENACDYAVPDVRKLCSRRRFVPGHIPPDVRQHDTGSEQAQRIVERLQLTVAKDAPMNVGVPGFDLWPPAPVHADYIHEIRVVGELRCVGCHVVSIPTVGQSVDDVRDLGFGVSREFRASRHSAKLLFNDLLSTDFGFGCERFSHEEMWPVIA
jgi:hypothetical protein